MDIIGEGCPDPIFDLKSCGFPTHVLNAFKKRGFTKPTSIQSQGWPLAMSGKDMIASAETGSGKTMAFLLPAFEHISNLKSNVRGPSVLILAPTRELALQIHEDAEFLASGYGVKTACLHGGQANRSGQYRQLMARPSLIVATPGRLIDFVEQGAVSLGTVSFAILDEADRMLDMGFDEDVRQILGMTDPKRQTLMWSATWPKKVQSLASTLLNDPIRIRIGSDEISANKNVVQHFVFCERHQKIDLFKDLIEKLNIKKDFIKTLVFTETKMQADILANSIEADGYFTDALHGDKPQGQRNNILESFKRGRFNVLIATDVAARGLDISDVQIVINYSLPKIVEHYVHRIGRTGRAGKTGVSYSFFVPSVDDHLAPEMKSLLIDSEQQIPPELVTIAQRNAKPPKSRSNSRSQPRRLYQFADGGRPSRRESGRSSGYSQRSWENNGPSSRSGSRGGGGRSSTYGASKRSRWDDEYDY